MSDDVAKGEDISESARLACGNLADNWKLLSRASTTKKTDDITCQATPDGSSFEATYMFEKAKQGRRVTIPLAISATNQAKVFNNTHGLSKHDGGAYVEPVMDPKTDVQVGIRATFPTHKPEM